MDIDISDLINHSDQNLSDLVIRPEVFVGKGQGSVNQRVSGEISVSQNDINRQILQQLNSLGDRLAAIENTRKSRPHKNTSDVRKIKSSNRQKRPKGAVAQATPTHQQGETSTGLVSNQIPTPDKLRQEAYIQKEVQVRLLHLVDRAKAGTDKIKTQRGGSVEVFISKRVK